MAEDIDLLKLKAKAKAKAQRERMSLEEEMPEETLPMLSPETPSQLEAGLRGAAQGATLGFVDELTAALAAAGGAISDFDLSNLAERYRQEREESRAAYKAAEEAFPTTYTGAELAGGLGTLLIPGLGAAKGAKTAATAAKGAKAAEQARRSAGILETAGKSSLLGGVTAGGLSEAEIGEGLTEDILTGAALGGAIGTALPLAGKAIKTGADLPIIHEFLTGRRLGKTGTRLATTTGRKRAQDEIIDAANKLGLRSNQAREQLGKTLGEIREKLAKSGKTADIRDEVSLIEKTIKKLQKSDDPDAVMDLRRLQKYLGRLKERPVIPEITEPSKAQEIQKTLTRLGKGSEKRPPVLKTEEAANVAKISAGNIGKKLGTLTPELAEATEKHAAISDSFRALGIDPLIDIITDRTTGKLALSPQAQTKVSNLIRARGKESVKGITELDKALELLKKASHEVSAEMTPIVERASEIASIIGVPGRDLIPALRQAPGVVGNIIGSLEDKTIKVLSNSRVLEFLGKTIKERSPNLSGVANQLGEISKIPDITARLIGAATLMIDPTTKSEITKYIDEVPKDVEVRTPKVVRDSSLPAPKYDRQYSEQMLTEYQANITPEMGTAGETLKTILDKIKQRTPERRKSMMFALEQNPAYRPLLKRLRLMSNVGQR